MNYESEQTEKINSKFEFPNTLNLKKYCVEEINKGIKNESDEIYFKEEEYYEYELKGINVHIGNAMGGHYISFIDVERDGHDNELNIKSSIENGIIKSKWLKFNDSIITEFDPKDIPIESYGGSLEENVNNENIQNAYLLIYERKKKTPIKIIVDEENMNNTEEESSAYNTIISFNKEKRANIDKSYDIFNSNNKMKMKEEELYKTIFRDEDENVCYSFIPYYSIDKNVLKDIFIEIMEKNQKFYKNKPIENEKYQVECNDILQDNIHLNEFNILDDKLSLYDKNQLISFFKEQIFENNIFKIDSLVIEDEHKIIINDKTNIYLEKLVLPILKAENKNDFLVEEIKDIILCRISLDKIFEGKNGTQIFDEKNTKLFCEIIYSLFVYLDYNK